MNYPVLVPVPIDTKGRSFWAATWIALTTSRRYRLLEDYLLDLDGITYIIPKGFTSDGASVPRLLWPISSPSGVLMIPGLLHDFAYIYGVMITKDGLITVDKVASDKLFLDVSRSVHGIKGLNDMAYWALRAFGYMAWWKHRRADAQLEEDFPSYLNLPVLSESPSD